VEPYLGEIRLFAGTFAPAGWAFCDGQRLSISEYDALYALIGTTYGGDGQTGFALPDLRGRWPVGTGSAPYGTVTLGAQGGTERVTLTSTQVPTHTHVPLGAVAAATTGDPTGAVWAASSGPAFAVPDGGVPPTTLAADALAPVGGNQPHENRPPYLAVSYIIALVGIFPSQS
jgi:microcystin-dependent protein